MKFRITYKEADGVMGTIEVEADSLVDAYAVGRREIPTGADIHGRPMDITPAQEQGAKGPDATKEKVEVVEIPGEDPGADPPANGGDKGGDGNWQSMLDAQEKEWQAILDEANKRTEAIQKEMESQSQTFTERLNTMQTQFNTQLDALSDGTNYANIGAQGFDPNQIAADSMTEEDRRMLLNMQSPLAGFREGMARGLGGTPQNYLAKNYLEGFADPARTAYRVLGGMAGQEGGDFTSYVENLFSGGSPRAQLGTMLGEGLSQLAGTGRAELAAMDPAKQRMFEQLTRPDISKEGGRANIQDVIGLAYGTQAQRFSPMILQQMRRGLPSQDELWADFQTQALGGGGDPNFARFVQQQFGL